ncbi:MAG: cytochrome c peroxidase [Akkermansiaceae bacterium]
MLRFFTLVFCGAAIAQATPDLAEIGRFIFADTTLSNPPGQSCMSCHQHDHAFADPRRVSPGASPALLGNRNAPSLMYAALIPPFAYEDILLPDGTEIFAWEGGLFQDGRAKDLFAQVSQPFFEVHEMNLKDKAELATRIRKSSYKDKFPPEALKNDDQLSYLVSRSLVEFLKSPSFRPFDSPFDHYQAGDDDALSLSQKRGLDIYKASGGCADCHFLEPQNWDKPLLSDFGYDNLGAPVTGKKDPGLFAITGDPEDVGKFRAPSLRNVELTAPYFHNGSIKNLREVLEFYNKRDLEPERWGVTDFPETVNHDDLGNLGLTVHEITDLLNFLHSFTDDCLKEKRSIFPIPPKNTPSTKSLNLRFPDYTHRQDPNFKSE